MGFLATGCGMTLHHQFPITSGFAQSALFQKITLWSVISIRMLGREIPKKLTKLIRQDNPNLKLKACISPTGFLATGCGMTLHHQFPITSGFAQSALFQKITLWSVISIPNARERDPIEAYETHWTRRLQFEIESLHIPNGIPCRRLRNDAPSSISHHFGVCSIRTISENYVMERHLDDQREERSHRSLRNLFDKTTPI